MKGIQKMNAAVEKVLNIMVAVSFTILIAACVLQVFTRFVLNNSLSWTEELARYAFIWSNLLGAAICTQKSSHATVTAITDALPKKVQTVLKIAVNLIIILVAYVLVRYGWKVVMSTRMRSVRRSGSACRMFTRPLRSAAFLLYFIPRYIWQNHWQNWRGRENGYDRHNVFNYDTYDFCRRARCILHPWLRDIFSSGNRHEAADSGLSESRNGAGFISSAGCSPVCVCRGFDGSRRNIQTDD